MKHPLFITNDDVRGAQFNQALEAVVPVDDPAIEVVEIRCGEPATIERHQWAQFWWNDWDDFQVAPLPAPALAGAAEVLPSGMTAAGVARRRASLAPQPSLPEVDHNIGAKAMSVSLEMESSITADFDGGGGAFMAAVEEDV